MLCVHMRKNTVGDIRRSACGAVRHCIVGVGMREKWRVSRHMHEARGGWVTSPMHEARGGWVTSHMHEARGGWVTSPVAKRAPNVLVHDVEGRTCGRRHDPVTHVGDALPSPLC
jgi:hypothetical protein